MIASIARPPIWLNGIAAIGIAIFLWHGVYAFRSERPADFYQFWVAGQAAASMEVGTIYSASDGTSIKKHYRSLARKSGSSLMLQSARSWNRLELAGTPFLYAVFSLVSSGDFEVDYRRFRLASLYAFAAGIVVWGFLLGFPPWAVLAALVGSTHLFWPFQTDVRFANVNQIQAGALILFSSLLARESERPTTDFLAGLILGLLLCFKPNLAPVPILLGLCWLRQRRIAKLSAFSVGIAGAVLCGLLVPWITFGSRCTWIDWLEYSPSVLYTDFYLTGGFLGKLAGVENLTVYAGFGAFLLAVTGVLIWTRALAAVRSDQPAWLGESALVFWGVALYLLSGPVVHSHYFVLMLPWLMLMLRPRERPLLPRDRIVCACAVVAWILMAGHPVFGALGITDYENHSLLTFLGVWILLGASVLDQRAGTPA